MEEKVISPADQKLVDRSDVFAEILSERRAASFVYRDDKVAAFMDIEPINEGHTLIVPVQPARFLSELEPTLAAHLFVIGQKVAKALRKTMPCCEGINLFLADGAAAGQEVPRVHLHVLPRSKDDGFSFKLPPTYPSSPSRAKLDQLAERIRFNL